MTAVEWFSNKAYELFEQYSEGKFDRIELNKLMLETTNEAKEMEKEQKNNLPIHIQEEISNTHVYIDDGIVHVKPFKTFKSE